MTHASKTFHDCLARLRQLAEKPAPGVKPGKRKDKKKEELVDRVLLRDLLIGLGARLEAAGGEPDDDLERELAELRTLVGRLGARWTRSLETEMQLACGEHIQGIDPRYLAHPRYDFDYAIAARQRLELRLAALEALGEPVDPTLLERVSDADERLATALEERARRLSEG